MSSSRSMALMEELQRLDAEVGRLERRIRGDTAGPVDAILLEATRRTRATTLQALELASQAPAPRASFAPPPRGSFAPAPRLSIAPAARLSIEPAPRASFAPAPRASFAPAASAPIDAYAPTLCWEASGAGSGVLPCTEALPVQAPSRKAG